MFCYASACPVAVPGNDSKSEVQIQHTTHKMILVTKIVREWYVFFSNSDERAGPKFRYLGEP